MNLLLVDDEPKILLSDALRNNGNWQVEEIADLDRAFNKIEENPWKIDLVLIDQVFKNTDADSILKSGLELGQKIHEYFPFVSTVMFTANSYDIDTQKKAWLESGFIDFCNKEDFTDRNAVGIINGFAASQEHKKRSSLRNDLKTRSLLELFSRLTQSSRNKITELLHNYEDSTFENSPKELKSIFNRDLFIGLKTTEQLNKAEQIELIRDFLHKTDIDIIFKGTWAEPNAGVRQILKQYEESTDYEIKRQKIDFEAANLLMQILNIKYLSSFDGEESVKMPNFLGQLTDECKDLRFFNQFREKMIARRVLLAYSELYPSPTEFVTLRVVLHLLKTGETNTFLGETKKDIVMGSQVIVKSRVYNNITASLRPVNIISTHLGLSSTSIKVLKGDPECKIIFDDQHTLFEERDFYRKIGCNIKLLHTFINEYVLPSDIALCYPGIKEMFSDLSSLKDVLVRINDHNNLHFETVIADIKHKSDKSIFSALLELLNLHQANHE